MKRLYSCVFVLCGLLIVSACSEASADYSECIKKPTKACKERFLKEYFNEPFTASMYGKYAPKTLFVWYDILGQDTLRIPSDADENYIAIANSALISTIDGCLNNKSLNHDIPTKNCGDYSVCLVNVTIDSNPERFQLDQQLNEQDKAGFLECNDKYRFAD